MPEAATVGVLYKKVFLKISQILQANTFVGASLIKFETPTHVFLWNLRNFEEHLSWRTAANDCFWNAEVYLGPCRTSMT